jgi:signal transduction histidine kinase
LNHSLRSHPFWPVAAVSGALAALALLALLIAFALTRQLQTLAMAGLSGLVLAMHGVSLSLALRGRFAHATWLIAAFQVLATVLTALLADDYWMIGLLLLAIVPVEVGVADKLGRMPVAIVFSLLGAAMMLGLDLASPGARIPINSLFPYTRLLMLGFLALHLIGLGFLLWRLRLSPKSPFYMPLDLATQQTLLLTMISAASIVLVTSVLIAQIRASQIEQVGRNFETLAQINAERVGNSLEQQINTLLSLGRQETVLLEGLENANNSYPESKSEIAALLRQREQLWQASAEYTDFILSYRSNAQTRELSQFRGAVLLHNNVFLTDRYGGLVAAQGEKPARFAFAEEDWWQAAWNDSQGGIYIGRLQFDPKAKISTMFIAVGVLNPQANRVVGVLASTYELSGIQREIGSTKTQAVVDVYLISRDGLVIAGPDRAEIGFPVWPGLFDSGIITPEAPPSPGVLQGLDNQDQSALIAHSLLETSSGLILDPLRTLGWQVVVSDTQENALAVVTTSTKVASLVGLITMVLVVIAAITTARVITRPIESLTTVAAAITAGKLSQRAEPVGPVELVTLAEAFNTLTARLRALINNLQEQVAQRTAQLEARAEQLATLNRITQAVSSVQELQAALEIVAREMVLLFKVRNTGIALLDEHRSVLTIVADYSQSAEYPSTVGIVLPVTGNSSTEQVISTARSIVIPNPQTHPLTKSIHSLMRERKTECLMIVPLLARGEVIGTIGLASNEPGRIFTEGEVAMAETIAGQITGAIDNARLFSETLKAREAAEAANQAKSDFLANISHELRTPLTSVLGFARIIQKRLQERIFPALEVRDPRLKRAIEQVEENIGIIIAEGERLTTLINDVLDLAKIEAGKVEWQVQPLSIAVVIEHAIASTSSLFDAKGLTLVRDVPDELPLVAGDRDRLIQVVINLLSNAVKFTRQGSVTCKVRLSKQAGEASPETPDRAGRQSRGAAPPGEIVVSVIDTGIGISPADQPRVFEKFTQVGDTLTDKPRGTGLGLPICKEIIDFHGGRIWVESELGRGSTFSFALPVLRTGVAGSEGLDDQPIPTHPEGIAHE